MSVRSGERNLGQLRQQAREIAKKGAERWNEPDVWPYLAEMAMRDGIAWRDRRLPEMGLALDAAAAEVAQLTKERDAWEARCFPENSLLDEVAQLRQALGDARDRFDAIEAQLATAVYHGDTDHLEVQHIAFKGRHEIDSAFGVFRPGQEETCDACRGTGQWFQHGGMSKCFSCDGTGMVPSRPGQEQKEQCSFCDGHGSIWTSWGGTKPVQCGHCHGTGREGDDT